MAFKSGMFNSVNGDRRYKAEFFAEYFASFIGNGVFPNPSTGLQIIANGNLTVSLKAGKAWINGYYFHNDSDHIFNLAVADGVLKRIDRIALRLDYAARTIAPVVKKGTFASSPVAPALKRDADAYELALADILINNGAINITQANITDTRLNPALCGIVHGVVDQVDTTTLFNQYQSWINQQKAIYETELDNWTAEQQEEFLQWRNSETTDFDNWQAQEKSEFENWVTTLEGILSGDVAGNLQLQIDENLNFINAIHDSKGEPNGLASLDEEGRVPYTQLPSLDYIPTSQKDNPNGVATLDSNARLKQIIDYEKIFYKPGNDKIFAQNTSQKYVESTTMTKVVEIKSNVMGVFRVSFQLNTDDISSSSIGVDGQIYINGRPVGALRTVSGGNKWIVFTEDLEVKSNDLIQLYIRKHFSNSFKVFSSNFYIRTVAEMEVLL